MSSENIMISNVKTFLTNMYLNGDMNIKASDLFVDYVNYSNEKHWEPITNIKFNRIMENSLNLKRTTKAGNNLWYCFTLQTIQNNINHDCVVEVAQIKQTKTQAPKVAKMPKTQINANDNTLAEMVQRFNNAKTLFSTLFKNEIQILKNKKFVTDVETENTTKNNKNKLNITFKCKNMQTQYDDYLNKLAQQYKSEKIIEQENKQIITTTEKKTNKTKITKQDDLKITFHDEEYNIFHVYNSTTDKQRAVILDKNQCCCEITSRKFQSLVTHANILHLHKNTKVKISLNKKINK